MKSSKVILFCVLLFCSKFVESIPFSEELGRQRGYQSSNWPVNQNAPGQYHNNGFARTQNGNTLTNSALQNDNTQDYYGNQGRYNYESHGYNNNPAASSPVKEILVDFDSPTNGQILGSFPPRADTYASRIDVSKVGLDNQQYKNQNWQPQNQYASSAASEAVIADHERPLITNVREPYRGSVQYLPTKYIPASTRQNYQADRTYQAREQYQYPLVENSGKNRYVSNSAIQPGLSSYIPYENYNEGHAVTSNTQPKRSGDNRYVPSSALQTGSNYNGVPALTTDYLAEKSGNNKHVENSRSYYGSSNTAPVNNQEDVPTRISDTLTDQFVNDKYVDNYGSNFGRNNPVPANTDTGATAAENSRPYYGSSNTAPVNNQEDVPARGYDTLTEQFGNDKYSDTYGSNFGRNIPVPANTDTGATAAENSRPYYGSSNTAPVNNQDDVPARVSDTLTVQFESDKNSDTYGSNFGRNNPVPANADTGATAPGNNKYGDNYGPQYKSSSPAPFDDTKNPDQNIHHQLPSEILSYGVKNIVSDPQIQGHLVANKKRFVIFHLNGTVEHVDKLDPSTLNNPKYRLLRANRNNLDGTKDYTEEIYTTQSPGHLQDNKATTPGPVDGHKLPPNINDSKPANINNSKPTPLVPSKSDDKLSSTTLSPIASYISTSPIPLIPTTSENNQTLLQSTTNSPAVVTTPCPDNTTDYITTMSPIETATDNVSDVPPITTTTASPVTTPSPLDTVTNAYNKQYKTRNDTTSSTTVTSILDKVQQYSTTTVSPSSSVSPIDDGSGNEIIIEIVTNKNNTQSKDTSTVNQAKNGESKTATYNSLTNTDVPTTEPSVQNDVNTGDTSTTPGDNLLESKQSETDLKITVSKTNDSEADIITVSIEVSESTDDDDSSSDDTLVVTIDTKKGNDDKSKSSKTGDCKKDHTNNDDKGKNLEIDLSNVKGKPTMWFKTTNQDFIDKLTSNNDTQFDVIYFFQMQSQPIVEKDKQTTIYCNGTVVIDSTITTWQYRDDPTPTIEKTTKIVQIEDYKS